jgi:transcriptional regulator with XRE-family HTH domain
MADKKIALGATGERLRENLARLRGGMQFKELSDRLAAVGRPIPPLGLRRIEAGERRVDVDDLFALAVVLGVSPLTLVLPQSGSADVAGRVTGVDSEVGDNVQWLWATGEEPLAVALPGSEEYAREVALFRLRARPHSVDTRAEAVTVSSFRREGETGEGFDARLRESLLRRLGQQGIVRDDPAVRYNYSVMTDVVVAEVDDDEEVAPLVDPDVVPARIGSGLTD